MALFQHGKVWKSVTFPHFPVENSTTGCGVLPKAEEMARKGSKGDPFTTLFCNSGHLLTISMGKSSPFDKGLNIRFPDS